MCIPVGWLERYGKGQRDMTETQPHEVTVIEALRTLLQEDFDDELIVSRIEIRVMQTGDLPYRLYPRDGSDYIGGVATARDGR